MKNYILLIANIFFICFLFGQAPLAFNYQAVLRDSDGEIQANKEAIIQITILSDLNTNTVAYREQHNITTNELGGFNLNIGSGTKDGLSPEFSSIEWGNSEHFLAVGLSIDGGAFQQMGEPARLVSVPYALYAENNPYWKIDEETQALISQSNVLSVKSNPADNTGSIISVGANPSDDTAQTSAIFQLRNRGKGGGDYDWRILTAAVGGGNGALPNHFAIWEYPNAPSNDDCCRPRLRIEPSKDEVLNPDYILIDRNGNLGVGQPIATSDELNYKRARLDVKGKALEEDTGDREDLLRVAGGVGLNTSFFNISHNRWRDGMDWKSSELKIQKVIDKTEQHYISFRGSDQGSTLQFGYDDTDFVTILENGRVGIGTNNPDQLFSVNGQASKVNGGFWLGFSDQRLKKDIRPFKDGLDILLKIEPVKYKYNEKARLQSNKEKEHIGIIAQDMLKVAPYMISKSKLKKGDEEEYLTYDGTGLTYILVNAVKEQQKQIEALEEELANREDRLVKLEAIVSQLQAAAIGENKKMAKTEK
jgi:hypothetical protein